MSWWRWLLLYLTGRLPVRVVVYFVAEGRVYMDITAEYDAPITANAVGRDRRGNVVPGLTFSFSTSGIDGVSASPPNPDGSVTFTAPGPGTLVVTASLPTPAISGTGTATLTPLPPVSVDVNLVAGTPPA